jgi:hypothetical protein
MRPKVSSSATADKSSAEQSAAMQHTLTMSTRAGGPRLGGGGGVRQVTVRGPERFSQVCVLYLPPAKKGPEQPSWQDRAAFIV